MVKTDCPICGTTGICKQIMNNRISTKSRLTIRGIYGTIIEIHEERRTWFTIMDGDSTSHCCEKPPLCRYVRLKWCERDSSLFLREQMTGSVGVRHCLRLFLILCPQAA